jgi:hypothetical protein
MWKILNRLYVARGGRRDLTLLTVWLVPAAVVALREAAQATGDSHVDTVNRALQVYRDSVVSGGS